LLAIFADLGFIHNQSFSLGLALTIYKQQSLVEVIYPSYHSRLPATIAKTPSVSHKMVINSMSYLLFLRF